MIETAAVGAAALWLWEKFGKDVVSKTGDAAAAGWAQVNWHAAAKTYMNKLHARHSTTTLLGNPRKIELSTTFTDVYVYDQQSAHRRIHLDEHGISNHPAQLADILNAKRLPLLDVARNNKRLYVLGKPGAGKSTFLKKIVLEAVEGRVAKTPIFVALRAWSDTGLSLVKYISSEFENCSLPDAQTFVVKLLEKGGAVLLFDGLDEISGDDGRRLKAIHELTAFSQRHAECDIVVTCRIAATDYSFDQFKYVEIADFNDEQQRDFLSKWYSHDERMRASFLEGWDSPNSNRFRDLAKTPLLLTLLCLAFDETLKFPSRRVELYQEAFNALLRKWDASRGVARDLVYKHFSHIRREQLLARLAWSMFFSSQFLINKSVLVTHLRRHLAEFPTDSGAADWDAERVVKAIEEQHGIIVERARGLYAFSHLTFQEYLTAKYVVENASDATVIRTLEEQAGNDQWKEVFLLTASLLDNAQVLFAALQRAMTTAIRAVPQLSLEVRKALAPADLSITSDSSVHFRTNTTEIFPAVYDDPLATARLEATYELALQIASTYYMDHGETSVTQKARHLAAALRRPDSDLSIWLRSRNDERTKKLSALAKYLRINAVYAECLEPAIVADRGGLSNAILAP